ncbi:Gfo/Idh/MocA family oxidoreductase [Methylomicrobium sp. Wu6]|uniref:Gfo/Idh/MocA family protein n=1 Tax=Methylomicrobium sp. Wu6 TaxID=3107928 RepID=UPI002DD68E87|nr:Gfo/Idh/MocA family oxidoreductase [Methylomicrobium sp. Wu6]MEC4749581.1 Gfo/Idh/MocA family oxidoreductase [Methylomicrobium sp. Wu6]
MIRVGIIGCGKIADSHVEQIIRIKGAEIIATCDTEELMAKQLAERFDIPKYYSSASDLLEQSKPDVVHITTPPQSHYFLGKLCLEAGAHVYMEKPFTVNTAEASALIDLATKVDRKITVGHDYQFTHAKRRMRELIKSGYLGGPPIHMESYHCYELGSETYAKAILGDKNHWVRMLPGALMHNNISHGIASIAEYLTEENPLVIAQGYTSEFLKELGEDDIIDELRVTIIENECRSAYFTFSTQIRPTLHHFRVYGKNNSLDVDHDQQTCIKITGSKYKSYLEKFIPPVLLSAQYAANNLTNISHFLRRDFHMKGGMKYLIEAFYKSITDNASLPISYKEILTTSKIMDAIFSQLKASVKT